MTKKKLNETYYNPDHLWAGSKAIKELHKITSTLLQVHVRSSKEIYHLHYSVQLDLLYAPRNVIEGNTCKYILTVVDVGSWRKVTRALRIKKESEVAFVFEATYAKGGLFKYPQGISVR